MIGRRRLGSFDVELSEITFGSMRLPSSISDEAIWIDLLVDAYDRGITTIHSSDEYDSFPTLCDLLPRTSRRAASGTATRGQANSPTASNAREPVTRPPITSATM